MNTHTNTNSNTGQATATATVQAPSRTDAAHVATATHAASARRERLTVRRGLAWGPRTR